MENWQSQLNGDPLPWLLEVEAPSIRFWTLTQILDLPESDPEVLEARKAILHQPFVQHLFDLQHPEGYWGEVPTRPYSAQGAVGVLSLLYMLV